MIGLDTNVLVRYIMQDDLRQSSKAAALIDGLSKNKQGYISQVTFVEVMWVLESCYDLDKEEISKVAEGLLKSKELHKECVELLWQAFKLFNQSNADFSDCLILVTCQRDGCQKVYTFDKKASKLKGMTLID